MNERLNAIVGAKISEFRRKMAQVNKSVRSLPKKTVVTVKAVTRGAERRIEKFQSKMDRLANTIRSLGTIGGNMVGGSLLATSPALIPIIASLVGLIGTLGPVLAVSGAGLVALGAAFGIAGGAALAFGAAAFPTIRGIVDGTAEATAENKKAMKQLEGLKKAWKGVQKAIEPHVAIAFGNTMEGIRKSVEKLNPMFINMSKVVSELSASFNSFMDSSTAKNFFGYLNNNAAPISMKLAEGMAGFIKGMMNLTVAFGPLTDFMAQGFSNMGQSFERFTQRVAKSEGLQSFMNYVKTNGPKIMDILGNIGSGLVGIFTAFGPLASDMLTGLQNMTARFAEWGKSLSSNPKFQKFIEYIRQNAPTVLSLIGNMAETLINLGIAMAPLGQKILEIANRFFEWTSSMLEANPWVGELFGKLLVGVGILQMFTPLLLSVTSLFSGLGTGFMKLVKLFIPNFNLLKTNFLVGMKMMGQSLGAFIVNVTKSAGKFIVQFARMGAQALIHAGRVAASWLIAMGPVGWVIGAVAGVAAAIALNWDKVKEWTKKAWDNVWGKVKSIGSSIVGFFKGINLFESGKAIIQSAIDGIVAVKDKIVKKVKDIAGKIRDLWPFSPAKEGPLSDIHRMDFGGPIGMSIEKARNPIMRSMQSLAATARNAFTPELAMTDIGSISPVKAGVTSSIQHSFNAEMNDFELPERPINIYVEGDAEWIRAYVNEENAVENKIKKF